jgi:hypothetical protein
MAIVTQANAVINAVFEDLVPALRLDAAAFQEFEKVGPENRATAGRFIFDVPLAADTTSVDPAVGAASLTTLDQLSVDVTMALLGNAGRVITGAHELNGAAPTDAAFNAAIRGVLTGAARTRNSVILTSLLEVPAYDTSWAGPDGRTYNTSTAGLVYLGAQTSGTRTSRAAIPATDYLGNTSMFTAKQACDKLFTRLYKDGVEPFISMDGEIFYPCFVHPNVMFDIKAGLGTDLRYINSGMSLVSGNLPAYGGLAFIIDSTMVGAGLGDSSANVYYTVAVGKKYLLKAALNAGALPRDASRILEARAIAEDMELRMVAGQDTSGYSKNLVWCSYMGYGIGLPKAGYRLETGSSLG